MTHLLKKFSPLLWLVMAFVAAWILWRHLHDTDFDAIAAQLATVSPWTVAGAVGCCALSYLLVGLYEGLAVRVASGRRERSAAFVTALIANPIGHLIGAAMFSGGALRFRRYISIGLTPKQIAAVVTLAMMPYLLAIGWLIDLCLLVAAPEAAEALHLPTRVVMLIGTLGLAKDIGWLVLVSLRRRPLQFGRWQLPLPSLKTTLVQIGTGAAEMLLVAAVLYLFLQAHLALSLPAFIAIYLIAIVVGQISYVPAGLGVLEAALLMMLPQVPPATLIGAVLAYRTVFELLPLLPAAALLIWSEKSKPSLDALSLRH
ncbi:MAG TPA: YbhN family protein [Steroidobacteraceae bacterium]|jgi:phosphatidylglycerol lysyltransferase